MITRHAKMHHKIETISVGGVYASKTQEVIRTVLGSCVAVCIYDPVAKVGGMNHYLLPSTRVTDVDNSRYGVNAMPLLMESVIAKGADRTRIVAKVFGGGHVVHAAKFTFEIPKKNIEYAFEYLREHGIRLIGYDVGGTVAREVTHYTETNAVYLRYVGQPITVENGRTVPGEYDYRQYGECKRSIEKDEVAFWM